MEVFHNVIYFYKKSPVKISSSRHNARLLLDTKAKTFAYTGV
jgi:hypothetical protein